MVFFDVAVEVNDQNARSILTRIQNEIEISENEAAEEVMNNVRQQMVRELFRQGSVKTGTGHRSLTVLPGPQFGSHYLVGRSYLRSVDEGTTPHAPRDNYRLRFWAMSEGWNVQELVNHIKKEGTDPHPFISKSFDIGLINAEDTVVKNIMSRIKR